MLGTNGGLEHVERGWRFGRYRGHYPVATLQDWANRLERLRVEGHIIHVYFDNDQKSAAPADALLLIRLFEDHRFGGRQRRQVTPVLHRTG